MIETKLFEVRDVATFIPVIASRLWAQYTGDESQAEAEWYLMRRVGFPRFAEPTPILLARLAGGTIATADPWEWNSNTMRVAHQWIMDHWHDLKSGDVVDVEFARGEAKEPKKSERLSEV